MLLLPQEPSSAVKDQAGRIDLDPRLVMERLDSWLDGAVGLLPNIVVAAVVLALAFAVATLVSRGVLRRATKRGRTNLGEVLGGFIKWAILLTGFLLAATIVMPSLKPGDLLSGLGVGSVAIGFAFKDILQNWLAGLLILIRQPFEVGDQIVVNDFEGTVERIETRATMLRTYDGQRVVIPNADIYSTSVLVKTAYEQRRSQYDIGIGYGDDIDEGVQMIKQVLDRIEGIAKDPAPEALPWDLAASWVTIRARWWTDNKRGDVVAVRAAVIREVKLALDAAGIDMPYETTVQLQHDQTDSDDGVRDRQREGWPANREQRIAPRVHSPQDPKPSATDS
ncbi:MAG: mechanosensitive ion channel family protein [Planctomycetota bacterium]